MNNHEKIKDAFGGLKAPDDLAEKVFNKSAGGAAVKPVRGFRKIASAAAIVLVALCVAGTGVYAAASLVLRPVEKADIGTSMEIVSSDKYDFTDLDGNPLDKIRVQTSLDEFSPDKDMLSSLVLYYSDEDVEMLNGMFGRGVFYTSDGEIIPAELIPAAGGGWYLSYNSPEPDGNVYNELGGRIFNIAWDPVERTLAMRSAPFEIKFDEYEAAAEMLGLRFALPDVPFFQQDDFTYSYQEQEHLLRNVVYVSAKNEAEQSVYFYAEKAGAGGEAVYQWHMPGVINETEIDGHTVFIQIDDDELMRRYLWQADGVAYCLFWSEGYNLSEEEYIRIIESMLP